MRFFLFLFMGFSTITWAGNSYLLKVEQFFKDIQKGHIDEGYQSLLKGSTILRDEKNLQNLKNQTRLIKDYYGKPLRLEKISETFFGSSLVRLVYLQIFPSLPITWEFFAYKPKDEWIIIKVRFVDNLSILKSP